jgi:hypothetical protein
MTCRCLSARPDAVQRATGKGLAVLQPGLPDRVILSTRLPTSSRSICQSASPPIHKPQPNSPLSQSARPCWHACLLDDIVVYRLCPGGRSDHSRHTWSSTHSGAENRDHRNEVRTGPPLHKEYPRDLPVHPLPRGRGVPADEARPGRQLDDPHRLDLPLGDQHRHGNQSPARGSCGYQDRPACEWHPGGDSLR